MRTATPTDIARWTRLFGEEEVNREVGIAQNGPNTPHTEYGVVLIQAYAEILIVDIALGYYPNREEKPQEHRFERFFALGEHEVYSANPNGTIVLLSHPRPVTDGVYLVTDMLSVE